LNILSLINHRWEINGNKNNIALILMELINLACAVLMIFVQVIRRFIMAINFDTALGIEPKALAFREKRSEILAANLANADTPNFKARDLDFKSVLKQTVDSGVSIERTQTGHIAPQQQVFGANLMYRNPNQVSLDGNTVEPHIEQARYAENAVQYQASLRFIGDEFAGLMTAVRGQ
jgi:flagellar basal-body rod protein FlgB